MNHAIAAPTFQTSDYGQAAYLLARGFALLSAKPNGNELRFAFESTDALVTAISQYSSNAPVPCRDFFHALRRTKALIRENTSGRRNSARG